MSNDQNDPYNQPGYGQPRGQWNPQQYEPDLHAQRIQGGQQQYQGHQQGPPAQPPYPGDQQPGHAPKKRKHAKRNLFLAFLGLWAVIGIIIAANSNGGSSSKLVGNAAGYPKTYSQSASSTPASAPASSAPASPSTPASPAMTTSQQQAVEAAQQYLSMGQGFSYQGLLQQLTSSDGNGFSESDAEFAISYLNPNWDQQAVEAAKGYLQLGGFSSSSLLQQLESSYGSGFTQAQAEYAVNQVMPS